MINKQKKYKNLNFCTRKFYHFFSLFILYCVLTKPTNNRKIATINLKLVYEIFFHLFALKVFSV